MESDEPTVLHYTKHLILQIFITFHILDLRFLLKSLLLRTNTKHSAVRAESVLHGVLTLAVSDPELRAGCLLPPSSHGPREEEEATAWVWFTAGAWLVPHRKIAVLGWTDPTPNPFWIQEQHESSGEMSGGELERNGCGGWVYDQMYFPFYLCWFQHLIFHIFISKNAPFPFTLTHFKLQDS